MSSYIYFNISSYSLKGASIIMYGEHSFSKEKACYRIPTIFGIILYTKI